MKAMTRPHLSASRFQAATPIALFASALLSSCSIIGLRQHVETMESRGGVAIQITPPPQSDKPTYAVAWRTEKGQRKDSAGFQRVGPGGIAAFNLRMDSTYRVGAFTDENGNGAYDAGEPGGVQTDVKPLSLSDPSAVPTLLKITFTRDHGFAPGTVIHVPEENKALGGKTNLALGEVASLDDKHFVPEAGGSGLWRPLDFLSGNKLGIYFTEPYDPRRIPVVFVYGIGGSPQDWRYFIDHFDREKYQLWFYHYPSGMRLDRVSSVLATGLRLLKQRDGFAKCYIVSHSMGGLVARTAITQAVAAEGVNFIPKFVSISTPWGGHKAAESGIRYLKKPVPSWLDVKPNSDFLLRIYETPLPKGTTHDLIYGSIEGGPFWMTEENDGVVTVESETDLRVKKSTTSFRHLTREHVEILNRPETLAWVQQILAR
jgi:pimeloyl-ACP methyl ester carboxylesterase